MKTGERTASRNTPLRATIAAGTLALLATTTGCSVDAAPKVSNTTTCIEADLDFSSPDTATLHTLYTTSAYGPGVESIEVTSTNGNETKFVATGPPDPTIPDLSIPLDTKSVMVDIIKKDGAVASCDHINVG